jgi:beta-glucanase (GH16 family)
VNGLSDSYHTYKLDWSPSRLLISLDNKVYFSYQKEQSALYDSWPFDSFFNIIVNTAVGGWWGAAQGIDDSVFPQTYSIDYIKYTAYKGSDVGPDNVVLNNIIWNVDSSTGSKWAIGCDWRGNDLASVQVSGDRCALSCATTAGCTHFTWNKYNGGTCWMKSGQVNGNDAMNTGDSSFVCGHRY